MLLLTATKVVICVRPYAHHCCRTPTS